MDLSIKRFQQLNAARQSQGYKGLETSNLYWSNALAGEAGELCNLVKKELRDGIDNTEAVGKELADIFVYCCLAAEARGLDLAQLASDKFNEVSLRRDIDMWCSPKTALLEGREVFAVEVPSIADTQLVHLFDEHEDIGGFVVKDGDLLDHDEIEDSLHHVGTY